MKKIIKAPLRLLWLLLMLTTMVFASFLGIISWLIAYILSGKDCEIEVCSFFIGVLENVESLKEKL